MLERKAINVTIVHALREKLRECAASSGLRNPIPELMWGRWENEDRESYFIGFHEKDELPQDEPIRIIIEPSPKPWVERSESWKPKPGL